MTNEQARLRELTALFAAYPSLNMTKESLQQTGLVYERMLADIPIPELRAVIEQCIADCKFLPTVAEIRDKHLALRGGLAIQTAAEAWGSVHQALIEVGSWGMPVFRNPLTAKAVQIMGWRELCLSESPAGVDRAQFERIYNSLLERQTALEKLLPPAQAMLAANDPIAKLTAQLADAKRLTNGKGDNHDGNG